MLINVLQELQHRDDEIFFEDQPEIGDHPICLTTIEFVQAVGEKKHSDTRFVSSLSVKDKPEVLGHWVLEKVSGSKFSSSRCLT